MKYILYSKLNIDILLACKCNSITFWKFGSVLHLIQRRFCFSAMLTAFIAQRAQRKVFYCLNNYVFLLFMMALLEIIFLIKYVFSVTCNPECKNGGRCIGKDRCACTYGYSGPRCENGTVVYNFNPFLDLNQTPLL